ncbi:TadE family protein [Nocardioides jensenii]|uniref:TadE family protein n=1 Tax=Nocardioides jensenii TaxID=1843 RepID=UPI0009E92FCA|nr:TadE family protein [Nocardioides jensenii]
MSRFKPERSTDRQRDQRGSVSIELVILLPALFAVLFVGMQAALYYHARTVAIAAAQEGARAAGAENGSESRGVTAAEDFIADVGDDVLQGPTAAADRTATTATVVIEARSLSVIPGWNLTIRQSATVPIERLTTP